MLLLDKQTGTVSVDPGDALVPASYNNASAASACFARSGVHGAWP